MEPGTVAILAVMIGSVLWIGWNVSRLNRALGGATAPAESLRMLQHEVQSVRAGVDSRLREQLDQARELSERLGRLQKATEEVEQLGHGLAELQRIFEPSQLRGALGERLLEDLVRDVLPPERYRVQFTYPVSGVRVDVAILMDGGRILPIDAKFPLANFRRYLGDREDGGSDAARSRRAFERDVRGHIEDISARYLSAEDGALDVAFMYIPSESVFYELIHRRGDGAQTLMQYALGRRVVPVSPSTLHAYLSVVRMGLRGFNLKRRAREVIDHLVQLGADVDELRSGLDTAQRQARHSLNNLGEVDRTLRKVEERLAGIADRALVASDLRSAPPGRG